MFSAPSGAVPASGMSQCLGLLQAMLHQQCIVLALLRSRPQEMNEKAFQKKGFTLRFGALAK